MGGGKSRFFGLRVGGAGEANLALFEAAEAIEEGIGGMIGSGGARRIGDQRRIKGKGEGAAGPGDGLGEVAAAVFGVFGELDEGVEAAGSGLVEARLPDGDGLLEVAAAALKMGEAPWRTGSRGPRRGRRARRVHAGKSLIVETTGGVEGGEAPLVAGMGPCGQAASRKAEATAERRAPME